jgi:peptide/nickel transport system substrate-binding protein
LKAEGRGTAEPIGTGPYVFESWTAGASLTVVKNRDYWQEGLPHLDEIEFTVVNDSSSVASGLQSDDIDVAFTSTMAAVNQIPDSFTVLKDWGSAPGLAITNTNPDTGSGQANPMANEHARKALAYATDQQALADYIGEGVEIPSSPFPPSSKWGMEPADNGYVDHDVAKAKDEVAAYQAETGVPLATTLTAPTGTDNDAIVQLLQSQWAEAGIDTTLESVEASTLITNVVSGKYQVALIGMYSAPDPDQNWHYWTADNAKGPGSLNINFTQYTTPGMQANLVTGRESDDFDTRKAAYDDIVREINGAAVNIWTYSTPYSIIAGDRVHGLTTVADVPFGNYQPKTWIGELWLAD